MKEQNKTISFPNWIIELIQKTGKSVVGINHIKRYGLDRILAHVESELDLPLEWEIIHYTNTKKRIPSNNEGTCILKRKGQV